MTASDEADIKTTDSRIVYENRWMRVREDTIARRDGSQGIYGVVEKPDFVVIVPVGADDSVHLVEQYRYPVGGRFWEFPQGSWEHAPGADPLEVAEEMIYVGHLFEGYGYSTQGYHVFLAKGLQQGKADLEREEQDLVTRRFDIAAIEAMACDGTIKDATTIAALGLLKLKGMI